LKVIGKNGFTIVDFRLLKIQGHSNCQMAHARTTPTDLSRIRNHSVLNSVTQIAPELGEKTIHGEYQGKSRPLYRQVPKAMQQVAAFGPAHAEQARKLYQLKGTRHKHEHKNCLIIPNRSNICHASQILLSQHEQTHMSTNGDHLPIEPEDCGRRVQNETSCKKEVPLADMLEQNQPILKLVSISSRPGKDTCNQRKSPDVENRECAREEFVGKKPLNLKNGVGEKDFSSFTILQILENISSTVYLH